MEKKYKNIGNIMLVILILYYIIYSFIKIYYTPLGFDDCWNATVAANFAKYGEYRVSYPEKIVFYNMITTGPPLLVPTAIIYKIFGVSNISTAVIPLIYGIGSLILAYVLVCNVIDTKYNRILASIIIAIVFLLDPYFNIYTTKLLGESGALFWVLLFGVSMILANKHNKKWLIVAGISLILALMTKTSMIFIVTSALGMIIMNVFIKKISMKELGLFCLGFTSGFIFCDLLKLIQLGNLEEYKKWYYLEWLNMLNQSSGIDYTFDISQKFKTFMSIVHSNIYISIVFIMRPICTFFLCLIKGEQYKWIRKLRYISILGTSASSLLLYFLFLGGSGLNYARRLSVNSLIVRLSSVTILFVCVLKLTKHIDNNYKVLGMKKIIYCVLELGLVFITVPKCFITSFYERSINKYEAEKYESECINEFLNEVNELPKDAVLYVAYWWQEPYVTLYLDREMVDIWNVEPEDVKKENAYFLVGRRFDYETVEYVSNLKNINMVPVDNIEVQYGIFPAFNSWGLFSIYRIEEKNNYN